MQAIGLPAGQARAADHAVAKAVIDKTGSINQAAKAYRVSHSVACKTLVAQGSVPSKKRRPRGKSEARHRFGEVVAKRWPAACEVGVNSTPKRGLDPWLAG